MLIGLTQQADKLGFFRFAFKIICHCEPVRLSGVAIPLLRGEMYRLAPKKWGVPAILGGNRYLVPLNGGIATTSVRTGLAMTGNRESARQTPIYLTVLYETARF